MRIRNKNTGAVLQIVEMYPTKDDSYVVRAKDEEGRQLILNLADLMRDFEPSVPQEFEDPNIKLAEHLAGPLTDAIREVEALLEQGDAEAANAAAIILKTALTCEDAGIEAAMKYYNGVHSPDEYVEFMTEAFIPVCGVLNEKRYTGVEAPVGRVPGKTRRTGSGDEKE